MDLVAIAVSAVNLPFLTTFYVTIAVVVVIVCNVCKISARASSVKEGSGIDPVVCSCESALIFWDRKKLRSQQLWSRDT